MIRALLVVLLMVPAAAHGAEPVLTYLRPAGKGCVWMRYAGPKTHVQLARVEAPCGGARYAWSRDGKQGALLSGDGKILVHVVFAKPGVKRLAVPERGRVRDVGFEGSSLVALVMNLEDHGVRVVRTKEGVTLERDGQKYEAPVDGEPGLAEAFRWTDGAWKRVQITPSTWGWDLAAGVDALEIGRSLGPRSSVFNGPTNGFDVMDEAPKIVEGVKPPTDEPGHWARVGAAYVWAEDAEFPIPVAPLYVDRGGALEPLALRGVKDGEPLSFDVRGRRVLARSGDGVAHVIDLSDTKSAFVIPGAVSPSLWR